MTCPAPYTLAMLQEAEQAYHKLMTGTSVVEFWDQNGDKVRFHQSNRQALYLYIQDMRAALFPDCSRYKGSGPAGFLF
jgi:hypothetical protein